MADLNVHTRAYGDLPEIKRLVASVDPNVPIHVFDGRWESFPQITGEDYTPGLREWCETKENVTYHRPPENRLPFGHEYEMSEKRPDQYCEAQWIEHEVLPQDEWTLRLDSDEVLIRMNLDLDALDPGFRYQPVSTYQDGRGTTPRLWIPEKWTFLWTAQMVPRDMISRDAGLDEIYAVEQQYDRRHNRKTDDSFEIVNLGLDRETEYLSARLNHMQTYDEEREWHPPSYHRTLEDETT